MQAKKEKGGTDKNRATVNVPSSRSDHATIPGQCPRGAKRPSGLEVGSWNAGRLAVAFAQQPGADGC